MHWEYCYDFDARVKYIKNYKPKDEIEIRLKWFQLVPESEIPGKDSKAWEACVKAWEACVKAWEAYNKANMAYNEAYIAYNEAYIAYNEAYIAYNEAWKAHVKAGKAYVTKYKKELDKLHDTLFPGCPWNGATMFPEKGEGAECKDINTG